MERKCVTMSSVLVFFATVITTCLCAVAGQSTCRTPTGNIGICTHTWKCPNLSKLIRNHTPEELELLRRSVCGTYDDPYKLCCPLESCTTPLDEQGTCIGLDSCPDMMETLQRDPTEEDIDFIKRSRCDGPMDYSVCCNLKSEVESSECQSSLPFDSSSECCGKDSNINKIIGGNETAIDEYPWMALIEYMTQVNTIELRCGGVLISAQYVVTANHCVEGSITNVGEPFNVRLGEYDTNNPGRDCTIVAGGGEDCTDGTETIPIGKIISESDMSLHVALIKLTRKVRFTDFIQPICLPNVDFTSSSDDTLLYASGWGATETRASSNIKLKVQLPYIPNEECQLQFLTQDDQIWERNICAGGEEGKDTCNRDSGGPLMRKLEDRYELVGIVNLGTTCGSKDVPGVYAKVFYYLPWIKSKIIAEISNDDVNENVV